jgi:pimeloyl-ACP methyl ester carboxylesterase
VHRADSGFGPPAASLWAKAEQWQHGDIEYTQRGDGPHVLVVHGSGGGYDQGQLVVDAVLGDGFSSITPSRFGYLKSTFHGGATFDEQAHAYAYLLDHLGLQQVAVVALSHGGPSALLFATLHPERVSSLTLISAGVASTGAARQAQASEKGDALTTIFSRDWLYWGSTKLFRLPIVGRQRPGRRRSFRRAAQIGEPLHRLDESGFSPFGWGRLRQSGGPTQ